VVALSLLPVYLEYRRHQREALPTPPTDGPLDADRGTDVDVAP
jgi:hypothetical protein